MAYDDVLILMGEFGRYQRKTYFILCIPAIFCAIHKMAGVFLETTPDFRYKFLSFFIRSLSFDFFFNFLFFFKKKLFFGLLYFFKIKNTAFYKVSEKRGKGKQIFLNQKRRKNKISKLLLIF